MFFIRVLKSGKGFVQAFPNKGLCVVIQELEPETGSNRVGALEGVGRTIGVVDGESCLAVGILLVQGNVDRGAGADTVVGGGSVVGPQTRLEDIASTKLNHVQKAILETKSVVIAQEGVRGEGGGDGEALIPLVKKEVVGETDVEASGKLHLSGTGLDGEVVAGIVNHLERKSRAIELH